MFRQQRSSTLLRIRRTLTSRGAVRLAVLGGTALAFALTAGIAVALQPRTYESHMVLMVTGRTTDQATAPQQTLDISQVSQVRAQTYARLISSTAVAASVGQHLAMSTQPDELSRRIDATAPAGTNLIEV